MKKRYGWIQNIFKTAVRLDRLDNSPTRYIENVISIAFLPLYPIHEVIKVRTL